MENMACPLPTTPDQSEEAVMGRLLDCKRIAVVGASDNPMRPGHYVPEYLIGHGYDVVPVNPNHEEVFGRRCYRTLADIPGEIDLVNVFRRPNACADVTRDAIAKGAKGVWLQSGITNEDAKALAQQAKIDFIQDRCIMVEHRRHRR